MNWKQIKKDTPKAFEKLIKWLDCTVEVKIEGEDLVSYTPALPTHHILNKEIMPLRRLFDFFDEQGIYIYIHPSIMPTLAKNCTYSILQDDEYSMSSTYTEKRKATENTAFTKAFEILEKQ